MNGAVWASNASQRNWVSELAPSTKLYRHEDSHQQNMISKTEIKKASKELAAAHRKINPEETFAAMAARANE